MRIAFVTETYPPEINGVSLTVERTVRYLREGGHSVEVIRPRQPADRAAVGEPESGEWLTSGMAIPMYPDMRFGWAGVGALEARFARIRPDLVHVATPGPLGWAAVSAANGLGLVTTSDFRTDFQRYSRHYRLGWLAPAIGRYLRTFHNRTQRSFVPTQQTLRSLRAEGFERLEVVGRGVDLERFAPRHADAALRHRWSPEGGPFLLYVGRLAAEKNVDLALHAYRAARSFVPTARMIVVGDGPKRRSLERRFPDVQFVGAQSGAALAAHYASADVFLFPSLSDTFGNVTLEALASGLPVVAFDVAAASEHVSDRGNGRLVKPGDDTGFVMAACLLTSMHRDLGPMRRRSRAAASAATWPSVLSRFEDLLLDSAHVHRDTRPVAEHVA